MSKYKPNKIAVFDGNSVFTMDPDDYFATSQKYQMALVRIGSTFYMDLITKTYVKKKVSLSIFYHIQEYIDSSGIPFALSMTPSNSIGIIRNEKIILSSIQLQFVDMRRMKLIFKAGPSRIIECGFYNILANLQDLQPFMTGSRYFVNSIPRTYNLAILFEHTLSSALQAGYFTSTRTSCPKCNSKPYVPLLGSRSLIVCLGCDLIYRLPEPMGLSINPLEVVEEAISKL